jgi:predicted RNA-binding Zn-ribbon protein involved in translation (DUF1610 family)
MEMVKCQACGASLPVDENQNIVTCQYCGTVFDRQNNSKSLFASLGSKIDQSINSFKNEFKHTNETNSNSFKIDDPTFNIIVFVILCVIFFPLAIIYLIAYYSKKEERESSRSTIRDSRSATSAPPQPEGTYMLGFPLKLWVINIIAFVIFFRFFHASPPLTLVVFLALVIFSFASFFRHRQRVRLAYFQKYQSYPTRSTGERISQNIFIFVFVGALLFAIYYMITIFNVPQSYFTDISILIR